uniref:Uncharacterized protein n=1 Tax=Tetraselmis sp. GSL018 TaxID=582737 RepID=A0A061RR56_9CHLO|eukprot:CAMPEP_0177624694 /NCGR_PEP_ID=MMETSP0419_2-20121207/29638_1 /TAXON_ID=582737 /ORGANISM="Tetraselmis sp., Strain GSL018" /LENGTH=198 /DNA_ID=CAMNT_0019125461 /DNA_START=53 /DNA_END=649 /DNA_ORIENTATION=-
MRGQLEKSSLSDSSESESDVEDSKALCDTFEAQLHMVNRDLKLLASKKDMTKGSCISSPATVLHGNRALESASTSPRTPPSKYSTQDCATKQDTNCYNGNIQYVDSNINSVFSSKGYKWRACNLETENKTLQELLLATKGNSSTSGNCSSERSSPTKTRFTPVQKQTYRKRGKREYGLGLVDSSRTSKPSLEAFQQRF